MVNKLLDHYECPIDVHLYKFINTHLHKYYNNGFTPNIIAILSALFISNKKKTSQKQWIYIGLMVVLVILQCAHLGYQEAIYDKMEESVFLNIWRKMVAMDNTPEKTIQYTKYFGCGTWYLSFALLIIFWRK
jgi:hypothetical protein